MTDDRYQRRPFGPRFGALMEQTQASESSKGLHERRLICGDNIL